MLFKRDAWKTATQSFILSRLAILVITYVEVSRIGSPLHKQAYDCLRDGDHCLTAWLRFDTEHYVKIAYNGYGHLPNYETAFFPFYPLLIRIVGWFFGGSYLADYAASLCIANVCFYGALVLLYSLVQEDFGEVIAKESIFYTAFSPFGIFFFAGYTESLFLVLCLLFFFALKQGGVLIWWLAGICGGCAMLTRGTGLVLVLPFVVVFFQRYWPWRRTWRHCWRSIVNAIMPLVFIPGGLSLYMFYLYVTKGSPLLFSHAESHWGRYLSFPLIGIFKTVNNLLFVTEYRNERNLVDLVFTIVPVFLLIKGWRQLPQSYALFASGIIIFTLLYPYSDHAPLTSVPRYFLMLFPVCILIAIDSKKPLVKQSWMVFSLLFFVLNVLLFVGEVWTA